MLRVKEIALNTATTLVTIAALAAVAIKVHERFFSRQDIAARHRSIQDWRDFGKGGQRFGPHDASVTIVEFTDFQCPFCREAAAELREIRKQFPRQVAIVVRHFPLPQHEHAAAAAQAAECAARQGGFEKCHDLLFSSPEAIQIRSWRAFAEETGILDTAAFEACLSDPAITAIVKQDRAAGEKLGVTGTPTFLINDLVVPGYPGKGKLMDLVRSALESQAQGGGRLKRQRWE